MADKPQPPAGMMPLYLRQAMVQQYGLGDDKGNLVPSKRIAKEQIINDVAKQGVYNDFSEYMAKVKAYPGDELLFIADPEGKYDGANFLLCLSMDAYQAQLQAVEAAEAAAKAEEEVKLEEERKKKEEEDKLLTYIERDFAPRPWISLGSEVEVEKLNVAKNRPLLALRISKKMRDLSKYVEFVDAENLDKTVDLRKQIVTNFDLKRVELDIGLQCAPGTNDSSTQSSYFRSINKTVQYEPIELNETQKEDVFKSDSLRDFLARVYPLCEKALQQNETINIFKDEFNIFEEDDLSLGNRTENNIKDLHTLSDMHHTKYKIISCIDWLPIYHTFSSSISTASSSSSSGAAAGGAAGSGASTASVLPGTGAIAVSCAQNISFDVRSERSGQVSHSHILIWSMSNLMSPQFILETPGDAYCFRFNPNRPDILIAGLVNGQVALFDITDARNALKEKESAKANLSASSSEGSSGSALSSSAGLVDEDLDKLLGAAASKPIQPLLLSNIEKSHPRMVTDIEWLPRFNEVTRRGEMLKNDLTYSQQFVSIAGDGSVLFWDLRSATRERTGLGSNSGSLMLGSIQAAQAAEAAAAQAAALAAASHAVHDGDSSSSSSSSISSSLKDDEEKYPKWIPLFQISLIRPDNTELCPVRIFISDSSMFACATEDGELVVGDWGRGSGDDDDKEKKTSRGSAVKTICKAHYLTCTSLHRSPHFPDIFLTVGDWSFHIWKLGFDEPLFSSPFAEEYLAAGCWSPTRPGVLVTAQADGTIHFWDLLDQSHKPAVTQSVTSNQITSMKFCQHSASSTQYLAIGDSQGDLHILDVPRNLRRKMPSEEELMKSFYSREFNRVQFYRNRAAPPPAKSQDSSSDDKADAAGDMDDKAEAEYKAVLAKFKAELGIEDAPKK